MITPYRNYVTHRHSSIVTCCLLSLTLVWAFAAWTPVAHAQDTAADEPEAVYAQLDYMKVAPNQADDYLSIEREIWKPMHQERANDGAILGWQLYVVRYPGGAGHDYQYVTVTLYGNMDAVENQEFEAYAQRAHPDIDSSVAMQRTMDARDWVRSELWVQHDQVVSESATAPAPILQINSMKVSPDGGSDYLSMEQDMIKPIHEARIDAGLMRGWSLWQMMLPSGSGQRHNYGTVDAFGSMSAIPNSWPEGIVEEVHPDTDPDELMQQVLQARDLVHTELWELVDYVTPGSAVMSER